MKDLIKAAKKECKQRNKEYIGFLDYEVTKAGKKLVILTGDGEMTFYSFN